LDRSRAGTGTNCESQSGHLQQELRARIDRARETAEELLLGLPWERVYDFCERLYGHLTQDVTSWDQEFEGLRLVVARSEVQSYVADELSRLFLEECLALQFSDGQVERQDRAHTSTKVTRAQVVLGDTRLEFARKHFNKALKYFRHVSQPDPENAVKEAVCAVEATARALFPSPGAKTLGAIVKSITGTDPGKLPQAIAQTFHALYGFRSGGEGVGH
jgi:hypothetical protein